MILDFKPGSTYPKDGRWFLAEIGTGGVAFTLVLARYNPVTIDMGFSSSRNLITYEIEALDAETEYEDTDEDAEHILPTHELSWNNYPDSRISRWAELP